MRNRTVSMDDIAKALGVSKNAVSLALRGKDGVSEDLRQKIAAKAREMGYGQEKQQASQYILALIPQRNTHLLDGMFYQQVCFHMESYARSKGYLLTICSVSAEEEKACLPHPMLGQMPFQGVATIGNLSKDYCMLYRNCGIKYLMVDQYYDDIPVDSITTANTSATYMLTKHLIEKGHKKIQYIGPRKRTSSLFDRWRGYRQAMDDHGFPILTNSYVEADNRDNGDDYSLLKTALDEMEELPTAFVCGHDVTAKQVIDILGAQGLTCPQDFSVVGFDDIPIPEVAPLNLTTYRTPKAAIAQASIDCLTQNAERPPQKLELYGELVCRGSVRDIR